MLQWTCLGNILTASFAFVRVVSDKPNAYKEINHRIGSAEQLLSAINHNTDNSVVMPHPVGAGLPLYVWFSSGLLFHVSKYWKTAHCGTDGYIQHGYTPPLKVLSLHGWFIQKLSKDSNAFQSQELANSSESDSKSTKQPCSTFLERSEFAANPLKTLLHMLAGQDQCHYNKKCHW